MKLLKLNPTKRAVLAATAVLAGGILSLLPWRLIAQPSSNAPAAGAVANLVPLKLEATIPLAVRSAGVEWKGNVTIQVETPRRGVRGTIRCAAGRGADSAARCPYLNSYEILPGSAADV